MGFAHKFIVVSANDDGMYVDRIASNLGRLPQVIAWTDSIPYAMFFGSAEIAQAVIERNNLDANVGIVTFEVERMA